MYVCMTRKIFRWLLLHAHKLVTNITLLEVISVVTPVEGESAWTMFTPEILPGWFFLYKVFFQQNTRQKIVGLFNKIMFFVTIENQ